jgi:hypothetical protein
MKDIYIDIPSPFGLSRPSKAWCRSLAEYDADLRIYPSQVHPLFRLARVAHVNGPYNFEKFRHVLKELHPDTKIAIEHKLVAVFTLPAEIVNVSPERVIAKLRLRDQWRYKDADAVADALDQSEDADRLEVDRQQRLNTRARLRAAAISYRYRTGARVSLVSPRRPTAAAVSLPTPATS